MRIVQNALAGTMESSDCMVQVAPGKGVNIDLSSIVMQQFGDAIRESVQAALAKWQVKDVAVKIVDKGALDCVLCARLETALKRAAEKEADAPKEARV
jgi:citrate lyase subunit gamma (acyl carrier protein)